VNGNTYEDSLITAISVPLTLLCVIQKGRQLRDREEEMIHGSSFINRDFDTTLTPHEGSLSRLDPLFPHKKTKRRTTKTILLLNKHNTMTTNLEFHGHGDELLLIIMKDTSLKEVEEEQTVVLHQVMGHGDPLFQEVLSHDSPPKMALHSEFSGHGDDVLDEVIEHWEKDLKEELAKEKKLHEVAHTAFQTQGDPILKQYCDHLMMDDVGGQGVKASE